MSSFDRVFAGERAGGAVGAGLTGTAAANRRISGLPVSEHLLIRTRLTKSSKKLSRSERRKNLRGVFSIHPEAVIPESVILVDDIYTTGTTMDEAAFTLKMAGVNRIFFLTLCIGLGSA